MNKEELIVEFKYDYKKNWENAIAENFQLQQENKQLKEMIDKQDGCNVRRLQIFELKDKLCKELKNIKNLKQENKELKEEINKHKNILKEIEKSITKIKTDIEPWSIYKIDGQILFNIQLEIDKFKEIENGE